MEMKNNILHYIGFGAILATGAGFAYYIWNDYSTDKLNLTDWMKEYIKEIKDKIESSSLDIETLCHVYYLINEIEDFVFQMKYSDIESKRIQALDDEEHWRDLLMQSEIKRKECREKAYDIIQEQLNMFNVKDILQENYGRIKIQMSSAKRKLYTAFSCPYKLDDVYIFVTKFQIELERLITQQEDLLTQLDSDDQYKIFNSSVKLFKHKFRDQFKRQFKFDSKYLIDLMSQKEEKEEIKEMISKIIIEANYSLSL